MPIFEYRCCTCQLDFEELVFDRTARIHCPKCGSAEVQKCLSVFAHKSDKGFTPSSGSSCSGCSSTSCSSCSH